MRHTCLILTALPLLALCWFFNPAFAQSGSITAENPYQGISLSQYLEQKDIGKLNEDRIWEYSLPKSWSGDSHVGNLIYGLELYRNYADAYNQSIADLEIEGLRYRSWSFTKDDIQNYFEKMPDTFAQIKLLIEYLNRPFSKGIGNNDASSDG